MARYANHSCKTELTWLNLWMNWMNEWTEWMNELNEWMNWMNWPDWIDFHDQFARPELPKRLAENLPKRIAETTEIARSYFHSITYYIKIQFYLSVYLPATEEKHQNTQKYNFSTHNKNKYLTYRSFAGNTANNLRWQKKTDPIAKQQPPRDWTPSRKSELRLTCRPSLPGVILIGSNCEIWL